MNQMPQKTGQQYILADDIGTQMIANRSGRNCQRQLISAYETRRKIFFLLEFVFKILNVCSTEARRKLSAAFELMLRT